MFANLSMNYSIDRSQLWAVIYGVRRPLLQEKKSRLDPFLSALIGAPKERGEFRRGNYNFLVSAPAIFQKLLQFWLKCAPRIVYTPLHSNRVYVNSRTHSGSRKIL